MWKDVRDTCARADNEWPVHINLIVDKKTTYNLLIVHATSQLFAHGWITYVTYTRAIEIFAAHQHGMQSHRDTAMYLQNI